MFTSALFFYSASLIYFHILLILSLNETIMIIFIMLHVYSARSCYYSAARKTFTLEGLKNDVIHINSCINSYYFFTALSVIYRKEQFIY